MRAIREKLATALVKVMYGVAWLVFKVKREPTTEELSEDDGK